MFDATIIREIKKISIENLLIYIEKYTLTNNKFSENYFKITRASIISFFI